MKLGACMGHPPCVDMWDPTQRGDDRPRLGGGGDTQKNRLRKEVTENTECAKLLGGLVSALALIDANTLVNIDGSATNVVGPQRAEAITRIRVNEENMTGPIGTAAFTSAITPTKVTYVSNRYFTQPEGLQDTLRIHELKHQAGMPDDPEGFDYAKEMNDINKKCNTGGPEACE